MTELSSFSVLELRQLAKNKRLRGYSKLKKAELIDLILADKSPRSPRRSLSKLRVVELKDMAKSNKLRGYSRLRKDDLITFILTGKSERRSPKKPSRRSRGTSRGRRRGSKARTTRKSPRKSTRRSPKKSPRKSTRRRGERSRESREQPKVKSPRRSIESDEERIERRGKEALIVISKALKAIKNKTALPDYKKLVGFRYTALHYLLQIKDYKKYEKTYQNVLEIYGYALRYYKKQKDEEKIEMFEVRRNLDVSGIIDDLSDLKLPEIKEIAKVKGIEGYSKLKKNEIFKEIVEKMIKEAEDIIGYKLDRKELARDLRIRKLEDLYLTKYTGAEKEKKAFFKE